MECTYACMHACMHVHVCVCVCVCMCICMYSLCSWHLHHTLQQSACEFPSNIILVFGSHMTDHNSQVVRFSTFLFILNDYTELEGGIYNTIVHNTRVPLNIQKTTDIHRKCTYHLCHHYLRLVLTF